MKRGFKAHAERVALEQRRLLLLNEREPLFARALTKRHKVRVLTPDEIPHISLEDLRQLLEIDDSGWSGVTLYARGKPWIIHNTSHSPARQESDLTHEVAHIVCKHQPDRLIAIEGTSFVLRTYNDEQEQEANWLAGCLKLPRTALLWAVKRGMDNELIAQYFHASLQLVQYRRNVTGIDSQLRRARGIAR